jgi:hypothetical protein
MANLVFTIAAGRVTEFVERIEANDPANSILVIDILATAGIELESALRIKTTFADLVSGTTNFATNTLGSGIIRKTNLDQALVPTPVYDTTNFRAELDLPDQTWVQVAPGDGWKDLVIGYDSDSTAGTDANIVPCTLHDFEVTPDSSDVTATINVFYRAST